MKKNVNENEPLGVFLIDKLPKRLISSLSLRYLKV